MSNVGARDEILAGDDPVHPQTAEIQRILQAAPPDEVPAIRRLVVAGAQTSSNTQNRRWFHPGRTGQFRRSRRRGGSLA
jgi:hypothetical protein